MPASVYAILPRFAGDGGARVRTGNDLRDPRRCADPRREAPSQIQWRTKKSRRGYGASYNDRLFDLPLERLAPFAEIAAVEPVTDEEASTER